MKTQRQLTEVDSFRRAFCFFSGTLPVVASAQAKTIYSNVSDTISSSGSTARYHYADFYNAWMRICDQNPYAYIMQRNKEHSTLKSSEIVKYDFAQGNTVELGSFILSKYEAAVIAHIGSFA